MTKEEQHRKILEFAQPVNWLVLGVDDKDYKNDWRDLMEVIEKIAQRRELYRAGIMRNIDNANFPDKYCVRLENENIFYDETLLQATYLAVCDYVNKHS